MREDLYNLEGLRVRPLSVGDLLQRGGVVVALALVLLAAAIVSPAFYQPANIFNVLRQGSALGIVSIGQAIVILGGGFDLSVAAVMQLAVITSAQIARGRDCRRIAKKFVRYNVSGWT